MEQNATAQIELVRAEAERLIAANEALARLTTNPDFQLVIEQHYFKDEPARLASLLGDINGSYRWAPVEGQASIPPTSFVQMTKNITDDLHAIGALRSFFRVLAHRAEAAQTALQDLEDQKNAEVAEAVSGEEATNGAFEA